MTNHAESREMMTYRTAVHIGLVSGLVLVLSGCVGVATHETQSKVVRSDRRTAIGVVQGVTPGCRDIISTYPDTLDYPGHGQVSFEWKEARVKMVKEGPLQGCAGKVAGVAFVYYRPDPGFVGEDLVTFRTGSTITRVDIKVVK
ncbi:MULTISPECIES: hypothetical protein [Rhizobium]|uniref:hypothetical protein n=1 Tax=Rhizobium TaxID=379 RepID=UPI001F3F41E5|nr:MULTISPECIES: hypothetical protein [Rhizobium]